MDNQNKHRFDPDEIDHLHERHVDDYSRDEEIAAELTSLDTTDSEFEDNDAMDHTELSSVVGWVGLAISLISFFMMPVILGIAGIIVGIMARNRDAAWLGNTAIVLGVISIVARLFFIPFF